MRERVIGFFCALVYPSGAGPGEEAHLYDWNEEKQAGTATRGNETSEVSRGSLSNIINLRLC